MCDFNIKKPCELQAISCNLLYFPLNENLHNYHAKFPHRKTKIGKHQQKSFKLPFWKRRVR